MVDMLYGELAKKEGLTKKGLVEEWVDKEIM